MPDRYHELQSNPQASIEDGPTGMGVVQQKTLQPVWGRLTANGPASAPDFFEWEQLFRHADDGKWEPLTDIRPGVVQSSLVDREGESDGKLLLNPAIEANGKKPPVGTVVRLHPRAIIVDEDGRAVPGFLHDKCPRVITRRIDRL